MVYAVAAFFSNSEHMIIRKQNIKKSAEEVSMMMSFGYPDIKAALQRFYFLIADRCGHTYAVNVPITESDLLHFFSHDTFAMFAQKYKEQLSSWAFAMALRHKFILSSEDENEARKYYFLSPTLRSRRGRPRLDDDED